METITQLVKEVGITQKIFKMKEEMEEAEYQEFKIEYDNFIMAIPGGIYTTIDYARYNHQSYIIKLIDSLENMKKIISNYRDTYKIRYMNELTDYMKNKTYPLREILKDYNNDECYYLNDIINKIKLNRCDIYNSTCECDYCIKYNNKFNYIKLIGNKMFKNYFQSINKCGNKITIKFEIQKEGNEIKNIDAFIRTYFFPIRCFIENEYENDKLKQCIFIRK
jgi:uncharacterized ubiquitin-like protein YukD